MVYSKRFAESVIGFADKYRFDPFFRTEINIIGLEMTKAGLLLVVVAVAATGLYHGASGAISRGIQAALSPHASAELIGTSVIEELASVRLQVVMFSGVAIIIITFLFSYLVTRLALLPVRNALKSQKQFIGNVAHELRTPITVIKTNTEVALMASDVSPGLKKTLNNTIEELDRASEILNNLLSLSASIRPERMELADVDLGDVVRHVMQQLRGLSEPKQLEMEVRMSERRTVFGNAIALEQIVMNIAKNAIVYTPRGGRVLITLEPVHPNYIEFTVKDSGVGIARKDLFHIFEPYYRGDPSRKRGWGGSGLGLTIVSELVKLHGGKIAVRSAERRGTTVTVLLPAGREKTGFDDGVKMQHENASEITVDFSHKGQRIT